MGSSNLRILPTRLPSCSSASNAILKNPSLISSLVKLVRSELRRLLILTSSACEAPLMAPESAMITIEAMIAAGHLGKCCALAPRRIVSGAGTLLSARSGNRLHRGMIASRLPLGSASAELMPTRCHADAKSPPVEARFGVRLEFAENMGLRQIKFRDDREIVVIGIS